MNLIQAGFLPIQERDGNNQVIREYTWGLNLGGGIGGLLNLKQNTSNYFYLYDGKGNVAALIDSSQNIVASYRYDAFGKLLKKVGTFDQPLRFSTKQYDESNGLSYYGYRFYNPAIGRWITRDPLGELGGINLYGFVDSVGKPLTETNLYLYTGNNPVNFIDPTGEAAITVGICVVAMATDIGLTMYAIDKYEDEMASINEKIRKVEKQCETTEGYIEHHEKLEELRRQAIKVSDKMMRARGRGYAIGIPIAVFCGVSPFLPF